METGRRVTSAAVAAGVIALLATSTLVFASVQDSPVEAFLTENQANTWLGGLALGVVGALVLHHQPGNRLGPILTAGGLCASSAALAYGYATWGGPSVPLYGVVAWMAGTLWLPGFLVLTSALPLLFPDGRLSSRRWRWPAIAAAASGALAFAGFATTQLALDNSSFTTVRNALDLPVPDEPQVAAAGVLFFVTMGIGAAAAVGVVARMRTADRVRRQQSAWFVLAVLLSALAPFLPLPDLAAFTLNVLSVTALGVGILRHGLFDVEVVLTRTVVYAALAAAAVGLYLLAAVLVGSRAGLGAGAALLVAAATLLLAQGQARLQRLVARLLFGKWRDPATAIHALGERLATTPHPDEVLPATVDVLTSGLGVTYAEVRLHGENGPACTSGVLPDRTVAFPLTHAGEDVGLLVVGVPPGRRALEDSDAALLASFARQVAVAAHGVRATRELRRSRELVVTTREEERRRIHRDLHDGLGPALAGITLGLETAGRTARRDGASAAAMLEELRRETAACVDDVRRIVADLRPPVLEDAGLVVALERQAALLTGYSSGRLEVSIEADGCAADLPLAVEVAAFRIASEAMTNAARHAGATRCRVTLAAGDDLMLRVEDDGTGEAPRRNGAGLATMRTRAEELGGHCRVSFTPGAGTTVSAVLPLQREAAS